MTGTEGIRTITIHDFCTLYAPIRWSKHDTRLTQDQIVVLNKQYDKVCK